MNSFDNQSNSARDVAAIAADKIRARSAAINVLFDLIGKTVGSEAERVETIGKMRAVKDAGHITSEELAGYEKSVSVRAAKPAPKTVKPLEGRAKTVVDGVKKQVTDIDKLSKSEFDDLWRRI